MEVLRILVNVLEFILYLYLLSATFYVILYAIAGIFYRTKKQFEVEKIRKFAVFIPGYKEDIVIINSAKNALKQNYPQDKFEVIVIADSFSKETLDELNKLPIRVIVVEFVVSNKSKSLNKCMAEISDDYDVAFVLDADNIMEPDVLTKINSAFDRRFDAVQGHRTAKNLNANFAILDAISEEINNHIFRKGHRVLGLSSALIGSGMGLDYKLFKSSMATVDSVGEDKEIELKIIKKNYRIEYVDDAIIYDEKTQKPSVFIRQRSRWLAAQLGYFKSHFFDALKELVTKGNVDYFDKVIQFVQPPRILLAGMLFIISIIYTVPYLVHNKGMFQWLVLNINYWLALLFTTFIALILSIPRKFYNLRTLRALFSVPFGFIIMIISLMRIKGARSRFLHTKHTYIGKSD